MCCSYAHPRGHLSTRSFVHLYYYYYYCEEMQASFFLLHSANNAHEAVLYFGIQPGHHSREGRTRSSIGDFTVNSLCQLHEHLSLLLLERERERFTSTSVRIWTNKIIYTYIYISQPTESLVYFSKILLRGSRRDVNKREKGFDRHDNVMANPEQSIALNNGSALKKKRSHRANICDVR